MEVKDALILIFTGFLGSLGFSLLFRMSKRKIPFAAIGGALTSVVYVICLASFGNEFFQNLFPALFATAYSEVLARLTKTPATPYLVISIIPLVPGGKLYYTIYYYLTSNHEQFSACLTQTIRIAGGLAVGIILVSVIIREINYSKFKQIYENE